MPCSEKEKKLKNKEKKQSVIKERFYNENNNDNNSNTKSDKVSDNQSDSKNDKSKANS